MTKVDKGKEDVSHSNSCLLASSTTIPTHSLFQTLKQLVALCSDMFCSRL
ncbi:hypothetical protein RchiOBHm_Chr5g0019641 [Rosa chinensis]|uniref:Uncharacterized protein n=1 Tax=Rosa chinensis TaxID=74649 RepID=A0A2P6Q732_ROSCH|nr:hypothetical protein RchiOBHm_Chr5g0019641 [Rosa chinensis]